MDSRGSDVFQTGAAVAPRDRFLTFNLSDDTIGFRTS